MTRKFSVEFNRDAVAAKSTVEIAIKVYTKFRPAELLVATVKDFTINKLVVVTKDGESGDVIDGLFGKGPLPANVFGEDAKAFANCLAAPSVENGDFVVITVTNESREPLPFIAKVLGYAA